MEQTTSQAKGNGRSASQETPAFHVTVFRGARTTYLVSMLKTVTVNRLYTGACHNTGFVSSYTYFYTTDQRITTLGTRCIQTQHARVSSIKLPD